MKLTTLTQQEESVKASRTWDVELASTDNRVTPLDSELS